MVSDSFRLNLLLLIFHIVLDYGSRAAREQDNTIFL